VVTYIKLILTKFSNSWKHIFGEAVILCYPSRGILYKNGSHEGLFVEIIVSDVVERRVNILTPSHDRAVANIVTMPANIMCITLQTSKDILTRNMQTSLKHQKMTCLKPKIIRNLLIERAGRVSRIRTSCLGSPGFEIILQTG